MEPSRLIRGQGMSFKIDSKYSDDYCISVDWNLEKIKSFFGDSPKILTSVLYCRSCPADVVKLLLKQGADINCQDEYGYSPLMLALQNSNEKDVIRVLLEGGAEVNQVDVRDKTPLLNIYLERPGNCSVEIVKMLLDFKADVNHKDEDGRWSLPTAILNGRDDDIIRALVEAGAEVNGEDIYNQPLFVLVNEVKNCSVDTLKFLLANGADPNCNDQEYKSALVCAIRTHKSTEIVEALLENGADVNLEVIYGKTPLLLFLGDYFSSNCSISMVKVLLYYKADVNFTNYLGHTPLTTALKHRRCKRIVQTLLEGGAHVNTTNDVGLSPLCVAFRYSSSDVVKLLLDAGASPNICAHHKANMVENGQSDVCFALHHGSTASDIQTMLHAGASLSTCTMHSSALICATSNNLLFWTSQPLRTDVVQLLLDNGACVDGENMIVLQYALLRDYEIGAIQLLLDLPGMDAYVVSNKTLLHHAVRNPNCKIEAVELLINRNVQVLSKNEFGETPLHCAAKNSSCDPRVIKLLLKHGCLINEKTVENKTPFVCAVEHHLKYNILIELLLAGARIGKAKCYKLEFPYYVWVQDDSLSFDDVRKKMDDHALKSKLFEFLAYKWEQCDDLNLLSTYQLLTKFFLLQNPEFDIVIFQRQSAAVNCCVNKLLIFANKCLNEVRLMDSLQLTNGHTFRMFVESDCLSFKKNYVDQILMHLTKNKFPVFINVICARIGRSALETEAKKREVYTYKICSMERVDLNCDIVLKISEYLSDNEDLLNLILAFYKPVNQNSCGGTNKNNTLLGKRSCESSTELAKCPKLCC